MQLSLPSWWRDALCRLISCRLYQRGLCLFRNGDPPYSATQANIYNSVLPALAVEDLDISRTQTEDAQNQTKKRKRKVRKKDQVDPNNESRDPVLALSTSTKSPEISTKRRTKKSETANTLQSSGNSVPKKGKKPKEPQSPLKKKTFREEPPLSLLTTKHKSCLRCREKKIKCNEVKPTCNQCRRGLWTCQYGVPNSKKRSRNGCSNCKQRRRKCTEEKPSCAHCLRLDDDCEYADE